MTYVVRDYGSPVSLEAAECQFAVLDGEDGAPVAYVYSREDALRYAASADLLEALIEALPYVECAEDDPAYKAGAVAKVVKNMRAALAKARQSTPAPDCDGEVE